VPKLASRRYPKRPCEDAPANGNRRSLCPAIVGLRALLIDGKGSKEKQAQLTVLPRTKERRTSRRERRKPASTSSLLIVVPNQKKV